MQNEPLEEDYIYCPRNVLQPLLNITEPLQWSDKSNVVLALFQCSSRTLGVSELVSSPMYGKMSPAVSMVYRIERYKLSENEKALELYDTIYAATLQGKGPAEVMLEMLSTSMGKF